MPNSPFILTGINLADPSETLRVDGGRYISGQIYRPVISSGAAVLARDAGDNNIIYYQRRIGTDDEKYLIRRYDTSTGISTYGGPENNSTYSTLATAWTNRESLTYASEIDLDDAIGDVTN